jgi:hypothetical protein
MRHITTRVAGMIIVIGGLWGALIPYVGPYFHYSLGPDRTWTWTTGRLWLDLLPGIAAIIGGSLLLAAGPWPTGRLGALIALIAGVWFVVGPDLSYIWQAGGAQGVAHGSRVVRALEALGYHTGLGVLIAALAAYALPGFLRAPAPVLAEDAALAEGGTAAARRRDRAPAAAADPAPAAAADRGPAAAAPTTAHETARPAAGTVRRSDEAAPGPAGQPTRRRGFLGGLFGGRRRGLGGAH